MGLVNLEEQFVFYASYHHNNVNKIIHIFCVWPILWSAMVLCQYIDFEWQLPFSEIFQYIHPINVSFFIATFYAICYVLMDFKVGTLAAALVIVFLVSSRTFYNGIEDLIEYPAWKIASCVHIGCWITQFLGHGIFEGRAPALLDNLIQALLMAPLFVLLEVMFMCGYRKEFQEKMWKKVDEAIKAHKATVRKGKKKA